MDASTVDRWFSEYLEDFGAVARGERQVDVLLERYAVPLLITVEDSVVQMPSAEDVTRVVGAQLGKLRSESFATSVKVSGDTTVLNAASAIRREVLSRRRPDSSEIDRVEMTYLITDSGQGTRIAVMAVHDPLKGGPERAQRRE
jgi:hypothetical protein